MLRVYEMDRKLMKEKILSIVRNNNGLKAKNIATLLGIEKRIINSILNYDLGNECMKDKHDYWYAKCEVCNYEKGFELETNKKNKIIISRDQSTKIIADKIISLLLFNPGLKAYQIAGRIGMQKGIVNSVLYNKLDKICIKLDDNSWYLNTEWYSKNQ